MNPEKLPKRVLEAYIGEYASGKSENAVNRALDLAHLGRKVTLVDLDLVEPCYTLRPLKWKLEEEGVTVLAWDTGELIGLGETGNILKPEVRFCLRHPGDVILDIGYGSFGAQVLNLVEGAEEEQDLNVYAVINIARPMTGTVPDIVDHVRSLARVDGLINNSHLGEDTDLDFVKQGALIVKEAAAILGLPVVATSVMEELAPALRKTDWYGHPVRVIKRYLPQAFW
ncbi:MAG: hypothetical protein ACN4A7_07850 [Thermacetogeniaceae bacterium]|nr:hypothetical protein [Syntrophomonadaceae bacterium]HAF17022.1 hypothetical protein [Peptococcaceae bacterium]